MRIRSFIAVNLPKEIKNYLAGIIQKVKEKNKINFIKWVKPENLHLTLHFLGGLDKEQIEKIDNILSLIVPKYHSFELKIKDFGAFPNLNQPRVLYINCQEINNNNLKKLREEIGEKIKKIGFKIDERPWQIHLTIARIKKPINLKLKNFEIPNLKFKVETIELMKSDLQKDGPIYSVIKSYNLIK